MNQQIAICQGKLVATSGGSGSPFQCWNDSSTPTTGIGDGTWVFVTPPPSDLSFLQSALTFDVALFGELMGICVLLFIIGHSAGHVARNLTRV